MTHIDSKDFMSNSNIELNPKSGFCLVLNQGKFFKSLKTSNPNLSFKTEVSKQMFALSGVGFNLRRNCGLSSSDFRLWSDDRSPFCRCSKENRVDWPSLQSKLMWEPGAKQMQISPHSQRGFCSSSQKYPRSIIWVLDGWRDRHLRWSKRWWLRF